MQITTTMRYFSKTINAGEGVERKELSCTVGGKVNCYSHYGEQYGGSLKKKKKKKPTMWPCSHALGQISREKHDPELYVLPNSLQFYLQ